MIHAAQMGKTPADIGERDEIVALTSQVGPNTLPRTSFHFQHSAAASMVVWGTTGASGRTPVTRAEIEPRWGE